MHSTLFTDMVAHVGGNVYERVAGTMLRRSAAVHLRLSGRRNGKNWSTQDMLRRMLQKQVEGTADFSLQERCIYGALSQLYPVATCEDIEHLDMNALRAQGPAVRVWDEAHITMGSVSYMAAFNKLKH